jgi:ABC-type phosphate transport system substrate-binding protein
MATRRALLGALLTAALLSASTGLWALRLQAGDDSIVVIVNKANPAAVVGATELRPIFQTSKTSWSTGGDATPINLPEENELRIAFDRAVLGLDPERVARYWKDRKIRGGARPPVRVASSAAMLKAVAAKDGAVGYIASSEVNATVKVVARISGGKVSGP